MKCSVFNERFEIVESLAYKGIFKIYDLKQGKRIEIAFDRISDAEKWLESKGFVKD